jgi:YfiH family protein
MTFKEAQGLRYLQFESLSRPEIVHAIFTRQGGVSPAPWLSLNVGGTVGDRQERVAENRRRAFEALDLDPGSLYDVWQVHGKRVVCTASPRPAHIPHEKADAILTSTPGITLFMRFADCVPILLFDPIQRAVGLVHAGWKGTVLGTVIEAVKAMQSCYGTDPENILAAIGPSIGPQHYQVGGEVIAQVKKRFADGHRALLIPENGRINLDLWSANRILLEKSGVNQIEEARICTACSLDEWYSHRAESGRTGRFGALIALNEDFS